ncbi:hypothetical protein RYA05_04705 [Pseudomonas syringae pv. actinidiae]|nr:hypothetical protein [Pseudomonas syringae pv. actinidiae]
MNDGTQDKPVGEASQHTVADDHMTTLCNHVLSLAHLVAADGHFHAANQMRDDAYKALSHKQAANAHRTNGVNSGLHDSLASKSLSQAHADVEVSATIAIAELKALADPQGLHRDRFEDDGDYALWMRQRASSALSAIGILSAPPLLPSKGIPLGELICISGRAAPKSQSWQSMPDWLSALAPAEDGVIAQMAFIERAVNAYKDH